MLVISQWGSPRSPPHRRSARTCGASRSGGGAIAALLNLLGWRLGAIIEIGARTPDALGDRVEDADTAGSEVRLEDLRRGTLPGRVLQSGAANAARFSVFRMYASLSHHQCVLDLHMISHSRRRLGVLMEPNSLEARIVLHALQLTAQSASTQGESDFFGQLVGSLATRARSESDMLSRSMIRWERAERGATGGGLSDRSKWLP